MLGNNINLKKNYGTRFFLQSAYYHGAVVALVSMLPWRLLYKDITYSHCSLNIIIIIIIIITTIDKCTCMANESAIEKAIR